MKIANLLIIKQHKHAMALDNMHVFLWSAIYDTSRNQQLAQKMHDVCPELGNEVFIVIFWPCLPLSVNPLSIKGVETCNSATVVPGAHRMHQAGNPQNYACHNQICYHRRCLLLSIKTVPSNSL
jgi:hypothetical protein